MRFQEVGEVWGCQVVECFVGDEECFEVDSLFDGQPVEIMEDGGDVLSGAYCFPGCRCCRTDEYMMSYTAPYRSIITH